MDFKEKFFLDYEGLEAYDKLIKKYIGETAGSNEVVQSIASSLAEVANTVDSQGEAIEENKAAIADNAKDIEDINTQLAELLADADTDGSIDNRIATAVNDVIDGAPEALDTLKEIADWISEDETGAAALAQKVGENADAIAATNEVVEALDSRVDAQDKEIYDSIGSIQLEKIQALFREEVKVAEGQTVAQAIAGLTEDTKLVLDESTTVAEDVVVPAGAYIDAKGATFSGNVSVDESAVIENAVFTGKVTVGGNA